MSNFNRILGEIDEMVGNLSPAQNPVWNNRPSDEEIISLLRKCWLIIDDFNDFEDKSKSQLLDTLEEAYDRIRDAYRYVDDASDFLSDAINKLNNEY
jgi:hypothetical protein